MGGGGRVLTQKEQNAEYLRQYSDFIKNIKHLDLEKQEIELREESAKNALKALRFEAIRKLRLENKIIHKLLKIIFESDDVDLMFECDYNLKKISHLIKSGIYNFTLDKFENLIKDSPYKSLKYADEIEQRFEKGEKAIASADIIKFKFKGFPCEVDVLPSLEYAKIIKGRFELGEKKIMQKTKWIHEYAKVVGMLPEEMHNMLIASCL